MTIDENEKWGGGRKEGRKGEREGGVRKKTGALVVFRGVRYGGGAERIEE